MPPGPPRALTVAEEEALVDYAKYMHSHNFPVHRDIVRGMIIELLTRTGRQTLINIEKGPSDKWFRKFYKRHPELNEKVSQMRDRARTRMSNVVVIQSFFKKYSEVLDKLDIRNKEGQIFNCDETGFSDKDGPKRKVISIKGQPAIQQQVSTLDHVTAHLCICGDGHVLPSFIIYEGALPHRNYRESVPSSWLFGTSPNGYMDKDLFKLWFQKIFVPNCGSKRPVLLLLDNHDSHISLNLIDTARTNKIEILGYPAHTTHLLQPLDVQVIGPVKDKMYQLAISMSLLNKNCVIGRAKLPTVLSYAIDQKCSPSFIKSAFKKCGLIPFNPDAIDKSQLTPIQHRENFKSEEKTKADTVSVDSQETTPTPSTSDSSTATPCLHCSAANPDHPVFAIRKLPPELQSIFVTPTPCLPAAKKHRVITEARVITGDEIKTQLENREKEEREKREAIEMRKKEREEKRVVREREKQERKMLKEKKKSLKKKDNSEKQRNSKKCTRTVTQTMTMNKDDERFPSSQNASQECTVHCQRDVGKVLTTGS